MKRQTKKERQVAKDKQHKKEALRLHKSGVIPSQIASKLGVSARTIQRWLKDEKPVSVSVVSMKVAKDAPEPVAKNVAISPDKFDLSFSRKTAIRLMHLSEKALDTVEEIFDNPDARATDKLRAAKLIGDWVGVGAPARYVTELSTCSPSFLAPPPSSSSTAKALQAMDEDEDEDKDKSERGHGGITSTPNAQTKTYTHDTPKSQGRRTKS